MGGVVHTFSGVLNSPRGPRLPRSLAGNISSMPPKKGAKYRTDQKLLIEQGLKDCPGCDTVRPLERFHRNRGRSNGYESHCKDCRSRAGSRNELDRMNAARFLRRYGITVQQRDEMLDRQQGLCAICSKALIRPCLDHCHASGTVRGILCQQCNTLIGMCRDDPAVLRSAIAYLEAHGGENIR